MAEKLVKLGEPTREDVLMWRARIILTGILLGGWRSSIISCVELAGIICLCGFSILSNKRFNVFCVVYFSIRLLNVVVFTIVC